MSNNATTTVLGSRLRRGGAALLTAGAIAIGGTAVIPAGTAAAAGVTHTRIHHIAALPAEAQTPLETSVRGRGQ